MKGKKLIDKINNGLSIDYKNYSDINLLNNTQFIYELYLAKKELESFLVDFEYQNSFRGFKILNKENLDKNILLKRASYFLDFFNEKTDYSNIMNTNITNSINQYLTHWIYPYKGKFHPQMIRSLINIIGLKNNDLLIDPFSGSGTTAVESMLLGINFYGIDVSDLCVMLGNTKTNSVFYKDDIKKLRCIVLKNQNLDRKSYNDFLKNISENKFVRYFYQIARLVSISDNYRRDKNINISFQQNIELMIKSLDLLNEVICKYEILKTNIIIEKGCATKLKLKDDSVDGIITSPPYSIALDYIKNDEHSLKDLGFNLTEIQKDFIGLKGIGKERVELYNKDMKNVYKEMFRVLKKGKYAVIIIGNAKMNGKEINTIDFTIKTMLDIGFILDDNIEKIIFGLYNVMSKENILFFKKTSGVKP